MGRKAGIALSLVLAIIFTGLIVTGANKKYDNVTETVEVYQTTRYVPVGEGIDSDNTQKVEIVKTAAKGLATGVTGKTTKVSLVKGQYIYEDSIDENAKPIRPGYVEVFVPVDLSSSAYALAERTVNVHIIDKENGTAPMILENIRVLHCLDSQGDNITSDGNVLTKAAARKNEPASVGLEVPRDKAETIVFAASAKLVYLTRAGT